MNKLKKSGKVTDVALKPLLESGMAEVKIAREAIVSAELMTKLTKPKAKAMSSKAGRTG